VTKKKRSIVNVSQSKQTSEPVIKKKRVANDSPAKQSNRIFDVSLKPFVLVKPLSHEILTFILQNHPEGACHIP
jgi:hypothetical protein